MDGRQVNTSPVDVDIDRAAGLTITWEDGHRTGLTVATLRRRCPCVQCAALRESGGEVGVPGDLRLTGAELVGAFGLGLAWSDGHRTGVYRWDLLHSWCGCADRG